MLESSHATAETNRTATLWRFMDFTKYVAMLHRRGLFLTRADQMPDPFEGLGGRRSDARSAAVERDELGQRVLLSCWHRNDTESAAMWRIYLSSEQGVAIRSSIERLASALSATTPGTLRLGEVRYLDEGRDHGSERHELDRFFCKHRSFEYEREMRLVWCPSCAVEEPGRYLSANLEQLVQEVVIAPTAEEWFEDLVRSVTEKFGLRLPVVVSGIHFDP
jgi:hypothetical protein